MLSGSHRTLDARNGRSLCSHSLRHLRLGQSCLVPSFQQRVKEFCLLPLKTPNLCAHARPPYQVPYQLVMRFHVSPLSSAFRQFLVHEAVSFLISSRNCAA
jgi:hypothetical protein